ncbi:MAG: heat-inducible transcriptional repressor HrcA [Clostridia bacterium]
MELDDRKKKILSTVVEDYIMSAEPTSSKTIVDKYGMEYSSATIRSEMKLLEEKGYLKQLHVSSGRVPSSKGYRYYVDNLMQTKKLSMLDINYINNNITGFGDTEDLLEKVADTVSKILNRPTVVTRDNNDKIESIKILKISEKIILVILMSENGTIKDVVAKLTDSLDDNKLNEMSELLNKNLKGTPLEDLYKVLTSAILNELNAFGDILDKVCSAIKSEVNISNTLVSSNLESILELPEFSDIEKAKNFINMLSTKEAINIVNDKIMSNDLGIVIGSENKELLLKDCSVVSLDIVQNNKVLGKVSVVSPERLDYSKTISTLKYINKKVKSYFKGGE